MSSLSVTTLRQRLIDEFGYPAPGADLIAGKLVNLQPALATHFERWWLTQELPDLVVAGYTVPMLVEQHGMNVLAAILTLDWLLREPDLAKASLAKGHDHIVPRK